MNKIARQFILLIGIVSLVIFFLNVAIGINVYAMINKSEDAKEVIEQARENLEDYLDSSRFGTNIRIHLYLVDTLALFNLLFYFVVGVGCIYIYFKTETTQDKDDYKEEYMEQKRQEFEGRNLKPIEEQWHKKEVQQKTKNGWTKTWKEIYEEQKKKELEDRI